MIKTWQERCEDHPDHNGIVTNRMIQERMQEEIDALRAALAEQEQESEPVAWMIYTEGGTSAYVTDNPNDLVGAYRALPLYTAPPQRKVAQPPLLSDRIRIDPVTGDVGIGTLQETGKQNLQVEPEHQFWCASLTQLLASLPPKPAPCNCKTEQADGICGHCGGVGCIACDARCLPQAEPLSEAEILKIWVSYRAAIPRWLCFARAIEQAHGIKEAT